MKQDEQTDRLLRQVSVPGEAAGPAGACVDAETLAAWADGSLMSREREAAGAHAADCPRCLAALAALARTLPAQAAVPWWSRWFSWRLLVPLAAGAAAVALWVAVPGPGRPGLPSEPASSGGVSRPVEEDRLARRDEALTAVPKSEIADRPERRPAGQERKDEAPSAKADQATTDQATTDQATTDQATTDKATAGARADADRANSVPAPAASAAAETVAPPVPTAPPAEAADAATPVAPAAPHAEAATAARAATPAAAAPAEARTRGLQESVVQPLEIRSPDPAVRWRIAGSTVEQTLDAGRTWQAQAPGTGAVLTAGSSPSRSVCWLVGHAGTVLLFTRPRGWLQLPAPEPVDLTGVTATDDQTATVTTAGGRTYRTVDGGRTWTLQETPSQPF
jgi:hypothetical protein